MKLKKKRPAPIPSAHQKQIRFFTVMCVIFIMVLTILFFALINWLNYKI